MTEQPERIVIHCKDEHPLGLSLYSANGVKGMVIIASAVGVPQQFYGRYARFLSQQGYSVVTFDYRGTGESICAERQQEICLEDWGIKDVTAVIKFASEYLCEQGVSERLYYVGHSIGGQIVGLAENVRKLKKIIMVAASAPYWKRWNFPNNLKVWLTGRVIIPAVALGKSEFPAKRIGLGNMILPSPAIKQWAKWMNKPDYLFCDSFQLNTSNYDQLSQPVLSFGFEDDMLAPEVNIKTLMNYLPNAKSEVRIVDPAQVSLKSIGHSGFFKERAKDSLWQSTLDWFQKA